MILCVILLERLKVSLNGSSIGVIFLEMLHEILSIVSSISSRNITHRIQCFDSFVQISEAIQQTLLVKLEKFSEMLIVSHLFEYGVELGRIFCLASSVFQFLHLKRKTLLDTITTFMNTIFMENAIRGVLFAFFDIFQSIFDFFIFEDVGALFISINKLFLQLAIIFDEDVCYQILKLLVRLFVLLSVYKV